MERKVVQFEVLPRSRAADVQRRPSGNRVSLLQE